MSRAFQFEQRDDGIGVLTLDVPDQKVNTLTQPVWDELEELVGQWESRTDLRGLLLRSGKPGQFIAGADLKELGSLSTAEADTLATFLSRAHRLLGRITRLPFPTVALIDGNCLGGGTELSLAFDERIASDHPATRIGLPEVSLGLIPGWGGTQRLPRLIGLQSAIDIICGGKVIPAEEAAAVGLVFDVVPSERLLDEGCRLIEHLHSAGHWQETRERRQQPLGLTDDQMNFAFAVTEGYLKGKTTKDYPAPFTALKAIRDGINRPLDEGLEIEQACTMKLVASPTCANLISVFFMRNKLQRDAGLENPDVAPADVNRVGVIGAGQMGAGIATAHARSGLPAVIVDVDNDRLAGGLGRARHVIESRIKIGRATPNDLANLLSLLSTSTTQQALADCDVVIEAVTENESLKTSIYKQLADVLRDDAILATNTSTISITRMAGSAPAAERFAGMHFFYPVDRMQLVEVVRGEKTSDETAATLVALARKARKLPIVVKDCPGFLVNRILLPYMNEAVLMLLEGAPMDAIDHAAVKFGMPMGPIALHDLVGLDTACYAGKVMLAAYGDRMPKTDLLEQMVKAGRLGKKSGAGFRKFVGKKSKPVLDPEFNPLLEQCRTGDRLFTDDEIRDRLFLAMLLEATRTLEEGIVREPEHVDMGLILGIGFPPFRGGILHWARQEGGALLDRLEPYVALGKRFEPTDTLKQLVTSD